MRSFVQPCQQINSKLNQQYLFAIIFAASSIYRTLYILQMKPIASLLPLIHHLTFITGPVMGGKTSFISGQTQIGFNHARPVKGRELWMWAEWEGARDVVRDALVGEGMREGVMSMVNGFAAWVAEHGQNLEGVHRPVHLNETVPKTSLGVEEVAGDGEEREVIDLKEDDQIVIDLTGDDFEVLLHVV